MVTKSIERAQKKIESRNFSIRKHVLEYDDVMNQQREVVYDRRNYAMKGDDILSEINEISSEYFENIISSYCQSANSEDWNWDDLEADVMDTFSLDISQCRNNISDIGKINQYINKGTSGILKFKDETSDLEMFEKFQRYIISSTIDKSWREHLYAMDQLREGIGLRAYGQKNPLIEYKKEGFGMFNEMISNIDYEILKKIFRTNIDSISTTQNQTRVSPKNIKMKHDDNPTGGLVLPPQTQNQGNRPAQARVQPVQVDKKIGRNDPCPCGSEKKYKKCCGRNN